MNIKKLILSIVISSVITITVVGINHFEHALRAAIGDLLTLPIVLFSMFILPVAPIIYGLITRDKSGSTIVGIIPVIGLFFYIYFNSIISREFISVATLAYFGVLAILGGLEGYFASVKKIEYNILAICCFLFWVVIFVRGFVD